MTNKVGIEVGAKDRASGPIDSIRDKIDGLQKSGGKGLAIGVGAAAGAMALNALAGAADTAASAVIDFVSDSVAKAKEEQVGIERLDASLRANIKSWDGNRDAIEGVISEREKLAFSDGEQRDALALLATRTHDVNKALGLEREAMDLARLKGIDLATASEVIGKVYSGNVAILKRYGIQVKAGATATEALAEIQKAAGGQAEAFANTAEGSAQALQIAMDDLQEDIGKHLLPVMSDLSKFIRTDVIPTIDRIAVGIDVVSDSIDAHKTEIDALITAYQLLSGQYGFFHMETDKQSAAEQKLRGIMDDSTKAIEARAAVLQPYIDKTRKSSAESKRLAEESSNAARRIKAVGQAAGITGAKFDDMRDAIRDSAKTLNDQQYGHEKTKLSIQGEKLELKDNNAELKKLEAIKHPTRAQREDIIETKKAIIDNKEQIRIYRADLAAAGKVNMSVTKSWIDKLTDDESEAGAKAHEWYTWLKRVSDLPGGSGGGGASTPKGGGRGGLARPKLTASGGHREAGDFLLVGEQGPELRINDRAGTFLNAQATAAAMGGMTINVGPIHITGDAAAGDRALRAILDGLGPAMRQSRARVSA